MFSFLKRRRRRKLLTQPFPPVWNGYLENYYPQFAMLPEPLQKRLRDRLRIFQSEKYWEGVGGFEVTEEMQVVISAMACTLTLAFEESEAVFPKVLTVLIHGETYSRRAQNYLGGGVISEQQEWRLGEAWHRGPVALSWPAVVEGGRNPADGQNLVFHEFAHALDMTGGIADGIPPVGDETAERNWSKVFHREFEELHTRWSAGLGLPIDPYALTNEAELFSVATENYFERPRLLQMKLPRLYDLLNSFYRLDTAEW